MRRRVQPIPAIEATRSKNQAELGSLVGCLTEQFPDSPNLHSQRSPNGIRETNFQALTH
ncbi:MAG: hypothetical protein AB4426_22535 [Xenococcaceae cyanobacterium]